MSAQELIPKEKCLHYLSNSACGATDPLHMTGCSLCLRASREINNLLHLMLSDSSGSDGPAEADVQPHKRDEKCWNLDSLWYMSLGEHVADLQSNNHFWSGPGSPRGCNVEKGWAAEPGEERSEIQCSKVVSCKMRPRETCKTLRLPCQSCLPCFLVNAERSVISSQN